MHPAFNHWALTPYQAIGTYSDSQGYRIVDPIARTLFGTNAFVGTSKGSLHKPINEFCIIVAVTLWSNWRSLSRRVKPRIEGFVKDVDEYFEGKPPPRATSSPHTHPCAASSKDGFAFNIVNFKGAMGKIVAANKLFKKYGGYERYMSRVEAHTQSIEDLRAAATGDDCSGLSTSSYGFTSFPDAANTLSQKCRDR